MIKYDDLIGKPYKEDGRGPDGYDCYGVCMEVCKRAGINLPEFNELKDSKFLHIDKPDIGDLVLIRSTCDQHAGVMVSKSKLLQVNSTGHRGVHEMRLDHPWIKGRIIGYYRYVG